MTRLCAILLLLAAGCQPDTPTAPPSTTPSTTPSPSPSPSPGPSTTPSTTPTTALGAGATFADVIAALEQGPPAGEHAQCLFAEQPAGAFRIGARLDSVAAPRVALRHGEVPGSPTFSVGLLTPRGSARQLTRAAFASREAYGPVDVWLASLTPVSMRALQQNVIPILWVTPTTLWFSAIIGAGTAGETWTALEGDALAQFHGVVSKMDAVIVTADPQTPLDRIVAALRDTQTAGLEVVLAAPAAPERPPARDTLEDHVDTLPEGTPGVCQDGISDVPPGMTPAGGFAVMDRAGAFDKAVADACQSQVPAARGGGVMKVALRVKRDGSVARACIQSDPIGDAALRACVVKRAHAFRFGALRDGDFVNLALGVTLSSPSGHVVGLCPPAR